jgi:hypothetical protein
MRTSELIDITLDWAVSYALGHNPMKDFHSHGMTWNGWWETTSYIKTKPNEYRRLPRYSIDWEYGGPIIESGANNLFKHNGGTEWCCACNVQRDGYIAIITADGPTPLIAAMRAYVTSKLGDEIEIPEELK